MSNYKRKSQWSHDDLARGIGWFSLALGLARILTPRRIGRAIGVGDHSVLMRLIGLREVASGIGILTQPNPASWLKARVSGDALDLVLLGGAITSKGSRPGRVALAAAAVAGVGVLDVRCSREFHRNPGANISAIHILRTITINRSAEELFAFWRNFENLPLFMSNLKSVRVIDSRRSHWVARGPRNQDVEWDAEIINEHPNELIAWQSFGATVAQNAGTVRFEPETGGRGTVVKVEIQIQPPAGVLGATLARLFGQSPGKQIAADLARFKQLMEAGEISRTEGPPEGPTLRTSEKFEDLVRA